MTKAALRKVYKEKRISLTDTGQAKLDDLLLIQLQTAGLPFIQTLFSYWPIKENKEPNTHLFTGYFAFTNPGVVTCYPVTDFNSREMQAVATDKETRFVKNEYTIYEPEPGEIISPEEIGLIFVPLLAFDKKGYRLGYGKGIYDKYLARCNRACLKVGFSYFGPVDEIPEKHQFDVPLNLCITPQTVYVF
jgi:5-formyltetrahydrofolate cyclo-ligase